ncbi:MAG: hypothetical protein ACK5RG_08990 [Cyclobacteriaceae bacterium]|jgi:hypothetical protein|nr:hypothetical protein [Flammeovirgaceae bacterium]
MENLRLMFLLLSISAALFLVIGLFKPWVMLWWEDVQNRKKIILVYGSISLFFLLAYWIMGVVL